MKWLFWKEYRENRMVPIWFAILLGLLMTAARMMMDLPSDGTVYLLYTAWSLAGIFTAAGAISREVGNGTLAFLLAQPVSRRAVWWVKWLSGLGILAASIIATSLAWALVQHGLYGPDAFGMQIRHNLLDWAVWAALASVSCYAVAWSISALLDRAISAAMLTLVVCGVMIIAITLINNHYQAIPRNNSANIILFGFVFFPSFACASYAAFSRGEAMRNRRRLLWAAAGWVGGFIAAGIVFLALCSFFNRFQSRGAFIEELQLSSNGRYLLAAALNVGPQVGDDSVVMDNYRVKRLVVESVNGPAFHRVLPSGDAVAWSPEGRYLIYKRDGAPFGLAHTDATPVCVDIRTGREFQIAFAVGSRNIQAGILNGAWSLDGKWLALTVYSPTRDANDQIVFFRRADIPSDGGLWRPWSWTGLNDAVGPNERTPIAYFGGGPDASEDSPNSWQVAWNGDSRCLYILEARTFAAAYPGESAGAPASIDPLCILPVQSGGMTLQRSRDDRHVLITYPGPPSIANWRPFGVINKHQSNAVVDLVAATIAARSHSSRRTPSINDWTRRWSSAVIPPGWRASSLAISPNGRFLIQQHRPPDLTGHQRRFSTSVKDLSAPARPARDLRGVALPDSEDWLSDEHHFLSYEGGNTYTCTDVLTGKEETISLRGEILVPLPGNRVLLANRKSPDVLHIQMDVVRVK